MEGALKSTIEEFDISYEKFRILFINIFTILYKAATLNPSKLASDIHTIRKMLLKSTCNTIVAHIFILFVSLVVFAKFFFGYVGMSANIIAMLPILVDDGPELLTPAIIAQAVENIFFAMLDILVGTITVRYFMPCKFPVFAVFIMKNVIQISIGVSLLNIYRDLYNSLKYNYVFKESETFLKNENDNELFLRKESLI